MSSIADTRTDAAEEVTVQARQAAFLYGGVFLLSCAIILFEICVLRIFALLFSHHFTFAIVSVALLGFGLGGTAVSIFGGHRSSVAAPFTTMSRLSNCLALALTLFIVAVSFFPTLHFMVYMLLLLVPFVVGGIAISWAFARVTSRVNGIYCANLLGSAAGAIAVLSILNLLGGANAIVFIGVLASLAAFLFAAAAGSARRMILSLAVFLFFLFHFLFTLTAPYLPALPVNAGADKEIRDIEKARSTRAHVLETRWSAFGRTDLVQFEDDVTEKDIFIDGTAGSSMLAFDGNLKNVSGDLTELRDRFLGAFAYQLLEDKQKDNALIIGAGGGKDVLVALLNGVKHITAVDVNADLVDLVKKYSSYNGGIYTSFPNVDAVAEEGRAFVRNSRDTYSLIVLPLTVIMTSRSTDGYLLTENYLYTADAITDYLKHLAPDGQLVFLLHGRVETYRMISILLPVLEATGLTRQQAMDHFYVVGDEGMTLVAARKDGFSRDEIAARHALADKLGFSTPTGCTVFFPYLRMPGEGQPGKDGPMDPAMMDPALVALYADYPLDRWLKSLGFESALVTDDRPFFYNSKGTSPRTLRSLLYVSLGMLMAAVWIPAAAWALRRSRTRAGRKSQIKEGSEARRYSVWDHRGSILVFALLGIGFMMTETSLIQKFILFLGQPVVSLAILLVSLFLGMGIGGACSKRLVDPRSKLQIVVAMLLLIGVLAAHVWIVPGLFMKCLGCALWTKMLISVGLIAPLGVLMGVPFPYMLNVLCAEDQQPIIPWMWGINGVASVCGSMLAVSIGMTYGFRQVLLTAMVLYGVIIIACLRRRGVREQVGVSGLAAGGSRKSLICKAARASVPAQKRGIIKGVQIMFQRGNRG